MNRSISSRSLDVAMMREAQNSILQRTGAEDGGRDATATDVVTAFVLQTSGELCTPPGGMHDIQRPWLFPHASQDWTVNRFPVSTVFAEMTRMHAVAVLHTKDGCMSTAANG